VDNNDKDAAAAVYIQGRTTTNEKTERLNGSKNTPGQHKGCSPGNLRECVLASLARICAFVMHPANNITTLEIGMASV